MWSQLSSDLQKYIHTFLSIFEIFQVVPLLCKSWNSVLFHKPNETCLNFNNTWLDFAHVEDARAERLPQYIRLNVQKISISCMRELPIEELRSCDIPVLKEPFPRLSRLLTDHTVPGKTFSTLLKRNPDIVMETSRFSNTGYPYLADKQKHLMNLRCQARHEIAASSVINAPNTSHVESAEVMFSENGELFDLTLLACLQHVKIFTFGVKAKVKLPSYLCCLHCDHQNDSLSLVCQFYQSLAPTIVPSVSIQFDGTLSKKLIDILSSRFGHTQYLSLDHTPTIAPAGTITNLDFSEFHDLTELHFAIDSRVRMDSIVLPPLLRKLRVATHDNIEQYSSWSTHRSTIRTLLRSGGLKFFVFCMNEPMYMYVPDWLTALHDEFPEIDKRFYSGEILVAYNNLIFLDQ